MTVSYPPGEITPAGARRLLEAQEPHITYIDPDGTTIFHLSGPFAPVPGVQDGVTITEESLRGLMPTWRMLDQVGANQDGATFQDAVYSPAEIDMMVEAHGSTPAATRQVVRDWVAAWDAHRRGELHVFTPEQGLWWAPVRWLKAPTDAMMPSQSRRQRFLWTARIDDAFWRSYDSISTFGFEYTAMTDTFNYTAGSAAATSLGDDWPLYYSGSGGGYLSSNGSQARWIDDPDDPFTTASRQVVAGPYADFNTVSDIQVVSIVLGSIPEISFPQTAFNDLWARMGRNPDGTWNGYGVRARIGFGYIGLSRFNNFTETVMFSRPLILPPLLGEKFTLVAGYEGDTRLFKVLRNGFPILSHKESGTGSALGASYRGIGFGMFAAGALITQATPATVRKISAGTNSEVAQEGWLTLTNTGDVESWPRFLLYGPGYFSIGNGPDASDHVEFGPLLPGQVVLIETEPRLRSVVDLTPDTVNTSQQLNPFQQFIKALVTFATNNNVPPLLEQFQSLFGILPPQGNLYSYLTGRFTRAVPPKPVGAAPSTSRIYVKIDDGNADSAVVGALTPRRRWPL